MEFLDLFRHWQDVVDYAPGTVICSEGDPAEVMYVVISGEVELSLHGQLLGTEKAGGIFGEMAMVDAATTSATAVAVTAARLARLEREQFKECISQNSAFSLHVMAALANRLRAVDQYIKAQL
jgi:CRP-like cAMP-binding protein